ncbi:IclR family transcriptional regulator [Herbiconiux sp. 11R-BC]|uniref:IclR family transcriptional regulator n=1 Tax=Herbiconiux sp. 11R-BC TaxID=3111637 RepID=UPI003C0029E2
MASDDKGTSVKSAERALGLIEYVSEHESVSFGEILTELSIPRSSAHGLLQTLTATGWVAHDPRTRQYSLGLRAWQIGQNFRGHTDLLGIVRPLMDKLAAAVGETVQLAQLDGVNNVYIAISQAARTMRLASSVGTQLPAHATGIGKTLLGLLPPAEAERRLRAAAPLAHLTERTVSDVDELLVLLDRVRREGFAVDDEEYISGCRCVAVPLPFLSDAHRQMALSVTMPTSLTTEQWPADILAQLRATVSELEATIRP